MKAKNIGENGKVVAYVQSDNSLAVYPIRDNKGSLSCECLGFRASKSNPKECKHIRRYRKEEQC